MSSLLCRIYVLQLVVKASSYLRPLSHTNICATKMRCLKKLLGKAIAKTNGWTRVWWSGAESRARVVKLDTVERLDLVTCPYLSITENGQNDLVIPVTNENADEFTIPAISEVGNSLWHTLIRIICDSEPKWALHFVQRWKRMSIDRTTRLTALR
jgi:hypothetical protein